MFPVINLAGLYFHQTHYAEAEALYKRIFAVHEKAKSLDQPELLPVLKAYALVLYQTKQGEEPWLGLTLQMTALTIQKRHSEAGALATAMLKASEEVFGVDNPMIIPSIFNLAHLQVTQDQCTQAEPLFKRAVLLGDKALETEKQAPTGFLMILADYAACLEKLGRPQEAQALEKRRKAMTGTP